MLLVAFVLLFSCPQSAAAHDSLVDSDPAADEAVETLPDELTLTFSAALIGGEGSTEVVVTGPDGKDVADGKATVDGAMVIQQLASEAAAGQYHVIWKVVSSDGHPTDGEFGFSVSTGTVVTPSVSSTAPAAPTTEASSTPEPTSTAAPTANASSGASAWIWALSIGGIAIIAALMVWFTMRARRKDAPTDSAPSAER